ncbi:Scn10a [Symbiodinium natans]|uniref:Scn10a protein n=1 Tax=Symbiodinium natans TaxID=878477 RepID=A0A812HQB9_9DINO|nr:Scn10a [Symbiodinium natans]
MMEPMEPMEPDGTDGTDRARNDQMRGWDFQADHEEEHEDLTMPLFPSTKMNIPKTLTEEKNLAELLFDDQEEHSGPYAWIEHTWAQTVVAAVIVLNAVLFGLESDVQSGLWGPIEHVILIIFAAEQAIRFARYRLSYFSSVGNLFDLFIVACGATDLWVMPLVSVLSGQKSSKSSVLQVMQLLRLLRIARLIRIVKIIPPLYSLAVGIGEALQGMFWVLIFLFMLLYACAILTARRSWRD